MTGDQFADAAVKALDMGITYAKEDCQMFVEQTARRAGGNIPDYRGSNDMLRNACNKVIPLDEAIRTGQLRRGWLLFIREFDGKEPAQYRGDGMGNASHVGIYTGPGNPEVVHSSQTRGGVAASTLKNGWSMAGEPKGIDFENESSSAVATAQEPDEEIRRIGYINLPPEKNVFHRISPNKSSAWFGRINGGEAVEIVSDSGEWTRVRYGGHDGYVMSKFITTDASAQPEPMPPDVQDVDKAALIAEGRGLLKRLGAILDNLS